MRIIRTLLVLGGGFFLLPSPPEAESGGGAASYAVFGSALEAVSDAAAFCERRPGVCDTAGSVAASLEAKAKYSVKLIYEWASEASQDGALEREAEASDAIVTGSTAALAQSTLTIEDLIPEWRGPAG